MKQVRNFLQTAGRSWAWITPGKAPVRRPANAPGFTPGFTLIELMVVIVILSVGILGTMSMQLAAGKTNRNAKEHALAMEYATETLEQLMLVGLLDGSDDNGDGDVDNGSDMWSVTELAAGTGHSRSDSNDYIPADDTYYSRIFTLTWDVTNIDVDTNGTNDAKLISLTVAWENGARTINLTGVRPEAFE